MRARVSTPVIFVLVACCSGCGWVRGTLLERFLGLDRILNENQQNEETRQAAGRSGERGAPNPAASPGGGAPSPENPPANPREDLARQVQEKAQRVNQLNQRIADLDAKMAENELKMRDISDQLADQERTLAELERQPAIEQQQDTAQYAGQVARQQAQMLDEATAIDQLKAQLQQKRGAAEAQRQVVLQWQSLGFESKELLASEQVYRAQLEELTRLEAELRNRELQYRQQSEMQAWSREWKGREDQAAIQARNAGQTEQARAKYQALQSDYQKARQVDEDLSRNMDQLRVEYNTERDAYDQLRARLDAQAGAMPGPQ